MSYTKVKSIVFNHDKKEVTMETAPSNLFPVKYHKSNWEYYSNLWQRDGLKAVEIDLTLEYWSGNLQGSGNKFYVKGKKLKELFPWNGSSYKQVREFIIANSLI